MSLDFLYAPRPGMLRTGTPVVDRLTGRPGIVAQVHEKSRADVYSCCHGSPILDTWEPDFLRLDLRDPTARAHAAWAYVQTGSNLEDDWPMVRARPELQVELEWDEKDPRTVRVPDWLRVLARMASGDETVTESEARYALNEAGKSFRR